MTNLDLVPVKQLAEEAKVTHQTLTKYVRLGWLAEYRDPSGGLLVSRKQLANLAAKRAAQSKERWSNRYVRNPAYKLSQDKLDAMLERQSGRCAICKESETDLGRPLFVDHDHATGKVRGLLCIRCNSGLGCFLDSQKLLSAAKSYLAKTSRLPGRRG